MGQIIHFFPNECRYLQHGQKIIPTTVMNAIISVFLDLFNFNDLSGTHTVLGQLDAL